ncbi:MAG: polyprenyl synthetase family protein [Spirochaetales bacterium]
MIDYLQKRKSTITDYLTHYLKEECHDLLSGQQFGHDMVERLLDFTLRGKMIRGSLVFLGAELYEHEESDPALVRMAAVMELLQSFLLIHDDIMDRDRVRRGSPSIYAQYDEFGKSEGIDDHLHFGEAMGICAGDVAIFLATSLIADASVPDKYRNPLLAAVSREIVRVGIAQMGDVYHGVSANAVSEADVINVYRFKTGRYTFSLPLMCGAILAGASVEDQRVLGQIGEGLGIVFQIKDDEIGLFGSSDAIGKTVGSDIASDKKTLHRIALFDLADEPTRGRMEEIFGRENPSDGDIQAVLSTMRELGVASRVSRKLHEYAEATRSQIRRSLSGMPNRGVTMLEQLLEYNLNRQM